MKCMVSHRAAGILFRRSQNRMHVQKALTEYLLLGQLACETGRAHLQTDDVCALSPSPRLTPKWHP